MASREFEANKGRLNSETARESGKKGAAVTNAKIKKKKTFQESIQAILEMKASPKIASKLQKALGDLDGSGMEYTLRDAMVISQTLKAVTKQDTQAFNAIIDRIEGKPNQKIEQDTRISGGVIMLPPKQ